MIVRCFALAGAFVLVSAASAQALNTRTWISGTGVDQAGCGPIANPCRTLQYAHDNTNAGGEIDVKDSAGYGSLKITKAISVVSDGSFGGVLAPVGGNAIEVNAGASDLVVLRGLAIEGAKIGVNGIVFNSGAKLDISSCIVQNFVTGGPGLSGYGILLQPSAGSPVILIGNTTTSHNVTAGILYAPPSGSTASASLRLDRVDASRNGTSGIVANTVLAAGSSAKMNVLHGVATNNTASEGVYVNGNVVASVDLTTASGNGNTGFAAGGGATLTIGRSVAAYNGAAGLYNFGATVMSFGDNRLIGNGSATSGTIGSVTPQ